MAFPIFDAAFQFFQRLFTVLQVDSLVGPFQYGGCSFDTRRDVVSSFLIQITLVSEFL